MKRISLITGRSGRMSKRSFLRKINQGKNTLVKNKEIITDALEVVNTLKTFFSSIVKHLKIPEKFSDNNLLIACRDTEL